MVEAVTGVAVWLLIVGTSLLVAVPLAPVAARLRVTVRSRREKRRIAKEYGRYEQQFWRPAVEDRDYRFETPPWAHEQRYDWRWRQKQEPKRG